MDPRPFFCAEGSRHQRPVTLVHYRIRTVRAASKGLFDRLLADFQDDAKTVRALIDAFESSAKASGLTMAREHRTYGDLTKWLASVRAKWKAT